MPLSPHMQHRAADKRLCCGGEVPQKLCLCDNILLLQYICPAPLTEFTVVFFLQLYPSTFKQTSKSLQWPCCSPGCLPLPLAGWKLNLLSHGRQYTDDVCTWMGVGLSVSPVLTSYARKPALQLPSPGSSHWASLSYC